MRRLIRHNFLFLLFVFSVTGITCGQETTSPADATRVGDLEWLDQYREAAAKKWENKIVELEQLDATEKQPDDAILFIGSSSIRRWDDMATDMTPYRTIRRGYGGAKFSDLAIYAKRLIRPHRYRALVVFVGNDVTGKETDHTPDQVQQLVEYVVGVAHDHLPDAPVFLIEVTPTESRIKAWPKIRKSNERLREVALATPNTYFVPTASYYLRPDGSPRSELFVEDKLHLNEQGYDLWSTLIRRRLDDVFRMTAMVENASPSTN